MNSPPVFVNRHHETLKATQQHTTEKCNVSIFGAICGAPAAMNSPPVFANRHHETLKATQQHTTEKCNVSIFGAICGATAAMNSPPVFANPHQSERRSMQHMFCRNTECHRDLKRSVELIYLCGTRFVHAPPLSGCQSLQSEVYPPGSTECSSQTLKAWLSSLVYLYMRRSQRGLLRKHVSIIWLCGSGRYELGQSMPAHVLL